MHQSQFVVDDAHDTDDADSDNDADNVADADADADEALEKEKQFPQFEFRSHYNSFLPHLWIKV